MRAWAVALVVGLLAALAAPAAAVVDPVAGPPAFEALGSVRQAGVLGAPPGATVELRDGGGDVVGTGTTDALGGLLFRELDPGDGYTLTVSHDGSTATSAPFEVLGDPLVDPSVPHPPQSFYDDLPDLPVNGYGYTPMRDGVTLGIQTSLPGNPADGPYPTVVEYSGYDPSNPANGSNIFKLIANALGYAYVGVNIRGSGCSGGAFDFFENLQSLDGYDVIETVAAQDWAGRVGMVGISYPGISQLYVAQTQPPHLAAITPLSVLDDVFRGTLYPGGIFNDGFALSWATDRVESNRWPGGAGWVTQRINGGDTTCAANVRLRGQNRDLLAQIEANPFFPAPGNPDYPRGAEPFTPYEFVERIEVPTFLSGAWQDEQTGGHFPHLLERLTGVPEGALKVNLYNGTHADALGPELIVRLGEFLDLYVAQRTPTIPAIIRALAPALFEQVMGVPDLELPPDRFTGQGYADALAAYEAEAPIRVWWENGAGLAGSPGAPYAAGSSGYPSWPVPSSPTTWYLDADGRLVAEPPALADDEPRAVDAYVSDPDVRPRRNYAGSSDDLWLAEPDFHWTPMVDGHALTYLSDPLDGPLSIVGPGSVDLWLRSTAADTDVQVTLTEVYPSGEERYVQSGWLRASHRRLDGTRTTALSPVPTHLEADNEPMVPGELTEVRVGLFPVAHTFHSGSRLRLSISAPGGDRPLWSFDTLSDGEVNEVLHSAGHPSRLVLPVVDDAPIPDVAPACPSLRAQPCRDYVAPNVVTGVEAVATGEGSVLVSWDPVPDDGDLVGYEVLHLGQPAESGDAAAAALGPSAVVAGTTDGDTLQLAVDDLPLGRHAFAVRPVFGSGPGVESSASPLVTLAAQEATTTSSTTTTSRPGGETPTTGPGAPTSVPGSAGAATGDRPLPRTGSEVASILGWAFLLLVVGAILAADHRRTRRLRRPSSVGTTTEHDEGPGR